MSDDIVLEVHDSQMTLDELMGRAAKRQADDSANPTPDSEDYDDAETSS